MADIIIVQGDYKHIRVDFSSSVYAVESFKFTSDKLGICKHITAPEGENWYITLETEDTINLPECVATYDITVTTTTGKTVTAIHNGRIQIKAKINRCED